MRIVLATTRPWNEFMARELEEKANCEVHLVTQKSELTVENLARINPEYVFLPHWSYIIDEKVYSQFNCVIFHMTDLPFGRGGSPLQNLISRGIYKTKMSAIKCVKVLDGGPVYLKRDLSLDGSAREIFKNASAVILEMILEILEKKPTPVEQEGEVVSFERRTPSQSNLFPLADLRHVHDHIRMLDADGYPAAYLESEALKFEFFDSCLEGDEVVATVRIRRKSP